MKKNLFDRNLKIEINTDNKRLTVKEDKLRAMLKSGEFSQSLSIAAYSLYKTNL